jgi:hypothetical protein
MLEQLPRLAIGNNAICFRWPVVFGTEAKTLSGQGCILWPDHQLDAIEVATGSVIIANC